MTLRKTRLVDLTSADKGTWITDALSASWDTSGNYAVIQATGGGVGPWLGAMLYETTYLPARQGRVQAHMLRKADTSLVWPAIIVYARLQSADVDAQCYALARRRNDAADLSINRMDLVRGSLREILDGAGTVLGTVAQTIAVDGSGDDAAYHDYWIEIFNRRAGVTLTAGYDTTVLFSAVVDQTAEALSTKGYAGIGAGSYVDYEVNASVTMRMTALSLWLHDRDITDVLTGDSPTVLLEINRKSGGSDGFARLDVNGRELAYLGRALSLGTWSRTYGDGDLPLNSMAVELADADNVYGPLALTSLDYEGQTATLKAGNIDEEPLTEFVTLGQLRAKELPRLTMDRLTLPLEVADPFGQIIDLCEVDDTNFPSLVPEKSPDTGKLVPFIFGEHLADGGAVEGLEVAAAGYERSWAIAAYKTAAVASAPLQIESVWIKTDGQETFTRLLDHADYGSLDVTIVGDLSIVVWGVGTGNSYKAASGLIDTATKVRFNVRGHYISASTYLSNPVSVMLYLAQYYAKEISGTAALAYIDSDRSDDAFDMCAEYGVEVAAIIAEQDIMVLDLIGQICRAADLRPYVTLSGKIALAWAIPLASDNATTDADAFTRARAIDEHEIAGIEISHAPAGEGIFGHVTECAYADPTQEDPRVITDDTARTTRGTTISFERAGDWLTNRVEAFAVAWRELERRRNPRKLVRWRSTTRSLNEDIGDLVRMTHYRGPASGGWSLHPLEIWAESIDLDGLSVEVQAADVHAVFNRAAAFTPARASVMRTASASLGGAGTCIVTNGSTLIQGTGTSFLLARAGDFIRVHDPSNVANNIVTQIDHVGNNFTLFVVNTVWVSTSGLAFEILPGWNTATATQQAQDWFVCNSAGEMSTAETGKVLYA